MCGIVGLAFWRSSERDRVVTGRRMLDTLVHRGPDGGAVWSDDIHPVLLGHRRLSIIDLSEQGSQPMLSASGRYVVVFNGEIYNYPALREELELANCAPSWRGHSDTEVLLACVEAWGFEATLQKLVGMFAIGLWDRKTATLSLARDRLGEKPLYYGAVDGCFTFSSELKAMRAIALRGLDIDRSALAQFMRFGYIPAPYSIYQSIRKLQPGHFVTVSGASDDVSEPTPYWRLGSQSVLSLRAQLSQCDDQELIDMLHDRLCRAVAGQMVSDVPLGAFLSGGVDSSTVVSLMQSQSGRRIRTFTIGFDDRKLNEAPYARAVAECLGTEHNELFVTASDAKNVIPLLPMIYDEPFADSSQIPTALISRLTRSHVTVALTGDGADEVFAGYPRYQLTAKLWQQVGRYPILARQVASISLGNVSDQGWDGLLRCLPPNMRRQFNGRRMSLLMKLVPSKSLSEMYVRLMSRWQPEDELVIGVSAYDAPPQNWRNGQSDIDSMRYWDICHYLPDDLMVKVDRAAMAASLETRAPMLDHRVVELAEALPERMLVRNGVGKWALRHVLDRYVPRNLIDRPKAGFEVPLADWLRGPLNSWARALLDPQKIRSEGYLNARRIEEIWQQHQKKLYDHSLHLWNVLMFEAWLDVNCRHENCY